MLNKEMLTGWLEFMGYECYRRNRWAKGRHLAAIKGNRYAPTGTHRYSIVMDALHSQVRRGGAWETVAVGKLNDLSVGHLDQLCGMEML